jgi:drug/metabolite transporter (DMT)-like permease
MTSENKRTAQLTTAMVLWLTGLGIIHTGLMYVLMYAASAKLPTAKIAVLAFVYPAVAMAMDWAVYGHRIGLVQALGVPLIVTASLRVTLPRPRAAAPAPRTAGRAPEAASRPATPAAREA